MDRQSVCSKVALHPTSLFASVLELFWFNVLQEHVQAGSKWFAILHHPQIVAA
jgi:hypothetical protein